VTGGTLSRPTLHVQLGPAVPPVVNQRLPRGLPPCRYVPSAFLCFKRGEG
jgi:hypothetical protein